MNSGAIGACVRMFATALTIGSASAQSTQPVEWKVSEGGNGHWYEVRLNPGYALDWFECRDVAASSGGHLATLTTSRENSFVFLLAQSTPDAFNQNAIQAGPFLGGYQPLGSSEPAQGWAWVTGEPWVFTSWQTDQPDNCRGCGDPTGEHYLHFAYAAAVWNDITASADHLGGSNPSFVIEWDADCNADGLVDFGQIERGELADIDGDKVPDICESAVAGVVPAHGSPGGGTLVSVVGLGFGTAPTVTFNGIAATSVTRISSTKLTAITPPGSAGPALVAVDGVGTADAFVYLPACSGDLDQNGTVDAGDIALLLLEFGPCTSSTPSPFLPDSAGIPAEHGTPRCSQR